MPKSKKDKKISLTKTAKHGMEWKKKTVTELREAADNYDNVFVLRVVGMRGSGLRDLRREWKDSKLFLGKNKIMGFAIGKTPESELRPNMHKIIERLNGERGLLFTNRPESEVLKFFTNFSEWDYARGGNVASETVELEEGGLELSKFPTSMHEQFKALGLSISVKGGLLHLTKSQVICEKGKELTPEQAKLLRLFEIPMARFYMEVDSLWQKPDLFKIISEEEEEQTQNLDQNNSEEEMESGDEVEDDGEEDDIEEDE